MSETRLTVATSNPGAEVSLRKVNIA